MILDASSAWASFGNALNNSFYFVIDKIIDLMDFFMKEAKRIGRVALLISLLTAALNHILTGSGLKENIIKLLKATLFFLIVTAAYPRIIGWISSYSFHLAEQSVYADVKKHFDGITTDVSEMVKTVNAQTINEKRIFQIIKKDNSALFSDLSKKRGENTNKMKMSYTVVQPAAVLKIVFFIAEECIGFADKKESKWVEFPDFGRIIKGLICAGIIIFTGSFALLEYVVCFLEFMLVASVGIILLPLSIWEGSKFLSEGYVKAVIGFFLKLLFCNLAVFLLIYGFITLFYIISGRDGNQLPTGFTGNTEQIIFIAFTCLLFFFICKSAPGVAQSLLSGSPSLTGAGAIGAVAGAATAAARVAGLAKGAVNKVSDSGKKFVGGVAKTGGALIEANAAANAAMASGSSGGAAFLRSIGRNISQGLARSLTDGRSGNKSVGDLIRDRTNNGTVTGSGSGTYV